MRIVKCIAVLPLCFCSLVLGQSDVSTQSDSSELAGPFFGLEYRLIGPAASGRVSRVAGVPGDPLTYYAATASGGVWKSINGGTVWESIFDDQPVSSIGSIAVAPSDPNVVWVGSGEANIRGNVGEGNGIYLSTDAGKNWSHVWKSEGQIGTIIVHPSDPNTCFAAVLGSPFGPGDNRGIYRTTDGGKNWNRVLFVDAETGASDVCFDPNNPRILFAGTWQAQRKPWDMISGGPGSGLWMSRDGGDNWDRLEGEGLPKGIWGKVGVGVARTDSNRVYALIEATEGGLFRSDDGGDSWERINDSRGIQQRAWYYQTLTIDPTNADIIWFPQVGLLKTVDGGKHIRSATGGGWDYHDVWIDPEDTQRIIIASDAGVTLSSDGGETWYRPALPISQFYHVTIDKQTPYRVYGSLQDWGTVSGPSNSLNSAGILLSQWHPVGGGEAGHVVVDPRDPKVVWAGEYLGYISRWNGQTGQAPHMGIYPNNGSGHGAKDLRYRFQWTAPILISPHDPDTVYHAANVLFKTSDAGQTWQAISPDLTRDDKSKQQWAGGPITGDNTGVEFYCTIFAIDESTREAGVIWAGSDDGLVHVTRNAGSNWTNVTPPDMPEWATIACIETSDFANGKAYVVADAHRLDDETPYLWKTEDYGNSWRRLGTQLDRENYIHVVREDTKVEGLLYLGTERGVLVSHDDGSTWRSLRLNMPTVAIADMVVAEDDLVVATLGRSAYVLDDLTPVRMMTNEIASRSAHLFPPVPAKRFFYLGFWDAPLGSRDGAGDNPPAGASFTYWLKSEAKEVTAEIFDERGQLVRTLRSEIEPQYTEEDHPDWDPETELSADLTMDEGFNRATWDLQRESAAWVAGTRNDSGSPQSGPRVPPGNYTIRLSIDDSVQQQTLVVQPDPRSSASAADIAAQYRFCMGIHQRMQQVVDHVEELRSIQHQIRDFVEHRLKDPQQNAAFRSQALNVVFELQGLERKLHNPDAKVDYDVLAGRHGGAKIYSNLTWLAAAAAEHDGPPTQGTVQVLNEIDRQINEFRSEFESIKVKQIAPLNESAKELGETFVKLPGPQNTGPVESPKNDDQR